MAVFPKVYNIKELLYILIYIKKIIFGMAKLNF